MKWNVVEMALLGACVAVGGMLMALACESESPMIAVRYGLAGWAVLSVAGLAMAFGNNAGV